MEKLLLVDGSSVLSRNYYGSLPFQYKQARTPEEKEKAMIHIMKSKDGRYTNAVYATIKFLLKVIRQQKPTHMAVAWDISRDTFRREIYPAYKGTRGETPLPLKDQFGLMQEVLNACGIYQGTLEKYEADDIIGTFAKKFEKDIPTSILTGDHDALQLVSDHTSVWMTTSKSEDMYQKRNVDSRSLGIPDKTFEFTPATFREEYGLTPIQIIDMKALEGDSSDNIPGVKGVGPKVSTPLLRHYGTIEAIYQAIETTEEKELKQFFKESLGISRSPIGNLMKASNPKEGIIAGKEAAFMSKRLATIDTAIDAFQQTALEDLRITLQEDNMKNMFQELGFHSLLSAGIR